MANSHTKWWTPRISTAGWGAGVFLFLFPLTVAFTTAGMQGGSLGQCRLQHRWPRRGSRTTSFSWQCLRLDGACALAGVSSNGPTMMLHKAPSRPYGNSPQLRLGDIQWSLSNRWCVFPFQWMVFTCGWVHCHRNRILQLWSGYCSLKGLVYTANPAPHRGMANKDGLALMDMCMQMTR